MKQTLSINKIIAFVAFASAALMSSLFVFRSTHQAPVQIALQPEQGILFPVARDIKSVDLKTSDNQPFTLQQLQNHWSLLFFGFTHCSSICPVTLDMLNRAYGELKPQIPNLQVVFVSLDPARDDMKRLGEYTHAYNKDFIGASGKEDILRVLQAEFGIYSARDNANSDDYQLQHTPSIMLINPEGKWAAMFKNDLTPSAFADAVKTSVTHKA